MELWKDSINEPEDWGGELVDWIEGITDEWRQYYDQNFADAHEEYMRIFRSQWAPEDRERMSERSRLIAPATSQAVESNVAEIEEATFGRGKLFDIHDDSMDQEPQDVAYLKKKLHEDFAIARVRSSVAEVLINAAVYGTGVAEVVIDEMQVYKPATRPMASMEGDLMETGVETSYRPIVRLNPVQMKNFLIDPVATSVDEALGCAIDEFVSIHVIQELQEQGVYRDDVDVSPSASSDDIEPDNQLTNPNSGRVRLLKYYGKVPRELLDAEGADLEDVPAGSYVEAIVVVANGKVLKAIANPYMCQDRPIVAFQWDIVPSMFWGRGVCEKAYMSQKALDAELRARIDALALTTHPMMAVDATAIPRGHKLEVRPGRMLLTNGDPKAAFMPLHFGAVDQITFAQGQQLQQMVSQATGAAEANAGMVQNDVTAAGMSMTQGAIVKRQKRTLVNFQENFLIPFIRKAAWRYMQYDPENYPVKDYTFVPFSSLGAMAREYEVAQLTQILQVVPPESPAHAAIIKGIIDHLNVSNREELIQAIEQGNQPDPAAQQAAQQQQEMQMAITQGQVQLLNAQAAESQSRAQKYQVEAQLAPEEMALKYTDKPDDPDAKDFEKRVRMAELLMKEQELQLKQDTRMEDAKAKAEAELIRQLMEADRGSDNPTSPAEGPAAPSQGGL